MNSFFAVAPSAGPVDAGIFAGKSNTGVTVSATIEEALSGTKADVLVDFTVPALAYQHTKVAIEYGVRPIMGTTGFTPEQIEELDKLCQEKGLGGLIAPNFSIGAILMMKFAAEASNTCRMSRSLSIMAIRSWMHHLVLPSRLLN